MYIHFHVSIISCVEESHDCYLVNPHACTVGTSGDTGSAAIEAVRGFQWVDIIVLLPKGRCSNIQEKQMTTVLDDNVHVYRG